MFPQFVFILESRIKQAEARKREREKEKKRRNREREREPTRGEKSKTRGGRCMHPASVKKRVSGDLRGAKAQTENKNPGRPPEERKRRKKKGEEAREKAANTVLASNCGEHCTGKTQTPTLYWQATAQKKQTKKRPTSESQKFAPERLLQTATLRKGDLTWGKISQNSFWSHAPHPNTKT